MKIIENKNYNNCYTYFFWSHHIWSPCMGLDIIFKVYFIRFAVVQYKIPITWNATAPAIFGGPDIPFVIDCDEMENMEEAVSSRDGIFLNSWRVAGLLSLNSCVWAAKFWIEFRTFDSELGVDDKRLVDWEDLVRGLWVDDCLLLEAWVVSLAFVEVTLKLSKIGEKMPSGNPMELIVADVCLFGDDVAIWTDLGFIRMFGIETLLTWDLILWIWLEGGVVVEVEVDSRDLTASKSWRYSVEVGLMWTTGLFKLSSGTLCLLNAEISFRKFGRESVVTGMNVWGRGVVVDTTEFRLKTTKPFSGELVEWFGWWFGWGVLWTTTGPKVNSDVLDETISKWGISVVVSGVLKEAKKFVLLKLSEWI